MPSPIPLDSPKSAGYYDLPRADVIAKLPRPLGRVLDVGCGGGGASDPLRAAGSAWISGIELLPEPAQRAKRVYDEVRVGDALEALPAVTGPFDTILCYDVLEHLFDPLALLRGLLEVSGRGARLHVSVPNASHVSLLRDLIVRGTFGYEPFGHRDATHVRWFTRRDILALIGEAGWTPVSTSSSALHWRSRSLAWLTRGRSTEFFAGQWYILAESRR